MSLGGDSCLVDITASWPWSGSAEESLCQHLDANYLPRSTLAGSPSGEVSYSWDCRIDYCTAKLQVLRRHGTDAAALPVSTGQLGKTGGKAGRQPQEHM